MNEPVLGVILLNSLNNPRLTVSPYLVFVLIHSIQYGLGYLSMAIKPIQWAGQDVWVSVLLTGISFHVVIWMIYQILDRNESDLISIHHIHFGKWIGGGLNFFFVIYFLLNSSFQLRLFIEIIQVWLFPELKAWPLALVLLLLVYYIVSGGFRVIMGICMLSLAQHTLIFSMFFTAPFYHYNNLLPIMNHSLHDIIQASKELTFPYLGVEILMFCYTFIKTPQKSQKWAHLGNLITTFFYLLIIFFSLLLFNFDQLSKEIWPAFTKYKFVHFPFIERFDFIGASFLIFGLFPIVCIEMWVSSRVVKNIFNVKQLTVLPFFLIVIFIAVCLIPDRQSIEGIQNMLSRIGFYIIYVYIPFLFLYDIIRMKLKVKRT
ncbi:GerAB/ArcD/ProY family transporter [Paenibacillus planticolens]|uniref:GerAB/ArcD/ProY family transporter n=1 Tax=Paenibacillus planticolens TaxID=2654976 RepID=A0ABX1ZHV4_9BACL|nr:GerAB/ArcD/ProY family transporter [Paenibacillus planticolens]NOU98639.1 GerAB/ArcD/ProY family transporter [Paenibacillus planticolens]